MKLSAEIQLLCSSCAVVKMKCRGWLRSCHGKRCWLSSLLEFACPDIKSCCQSYKLNTCNSYLLLEVLLFRTRLATMMTIHNLMIIFWVYYWVFFHLLASVRLSSITAVPLLFKGLIWLHLMYLGTWVADAYSHYSRSTRPCPCNPSFSSTNISFTNLQFYHQARLASWLTSKHSSVMLWQSSWKHLQKAAIEGMKRRAEIEHLETIVRKVMEKDLRAYEREKSTQYWLEGSTPSKWEKASGAFWIQHHWQEVRKCV